MIAVAFIGGECFEKNTCCTAISADRMWIMRNYHDPKLLWSLLFIE